MKADVFPQASSFGLDIPSWVPEPISQYVRAEYAADVDSTYRAALEESGESGPREYLAEVARQDEVREAFADWVRDDLVDITKRYLPLVCDRRMRGVWRELTRQSQGMFLHPARPPLGANVHELGVYDLRTTPEHQRFRLDHRLLGVKERQEMALVELFETALRCQETRWGVTMTARQVEQQRGRYLAKAQELQSDAIAIMTAPGARKRTERYRRLQDAADVYKEYAAERYWADFLMSLERRHDGRARWVVLTISQKFHTLFGSPMYGLTATITSVVLGRKVTWRRVRQWCHPADKARKKSA